MFLSRASIAWPLCRNPYEWHRAVWTLFSPKPDATRDFLFACLYRRPGVDLEIIALSASVPALGTGAGASILGEPKDLRKLQFARGQHLQFRLTANPTRVVTEQGEDRRKVRVPFVHGDQQVAWLRRKLGECAEVLHVEPHPESPMYFGRKGVGGKILPVTFEGRLRVLDSTRFMAVYRNGIGPAKAFGCGLLLVKPAVGTDDS